MKLLLEGSLSETLMIKDLLVGILQAEAPGVSVLQLFVNTVQPYGEIFLLGGHFVVGARLQETEISAEEAFNHLLQLKEARFNYYACDSLEALPADRPLKIDLKELIDNWQISQPVSRNDMLDKIFNKTELSQTNKNVINKSEVVEEEPNVQQESAQLQPSSGFINKQSDIDWELVNPLLVGGAPGDTAANMIGSDWEENAHSTQDLRSLAAGSEWQRKVRDLLLILLMLGIAFFVILGVTWVFMNSPLSDVRPKHFSIPFKHHPKKSSFNTRPVQH